LPSGGLFSGANAVKNWVDTLLSGDAVSSLVTPETIFLVLLLAFCSGHVIGWVYMITHTSLSYSRSFTASLVAIPVIVSLVMLLMAGNVMIALGLLAVFAVVRFRNVLKDTRDTSFILWAILQGMAVGTLRFSMAIIGCLTIFLIFLYLRITNFGSRHRFDTILSLQWTGGADNLRSVQSVLERHSVRSRVASRQDDGEDGLDLSYRLLLRDPSRGQELLAELEQTEGVARASLHHREDESEI